MPLCPPARRAELGTVDEGLRQRMLAMFPPSAAEEAAEGQAGGEGGAATGTGLQQAGQQLLSLHRVIVELDGKFITGGCCKQSGKGQRTAQCTAQAPLQHSNKQVECTPPTSAELTHTAALFAELFPPGGRKRLIKVGCQPAGRT